MAADGQAANDRYEVVIVKDGTRSTVKSDVFLNYHVYGEPDQPIEMDYFFWVVRNRERTVVVDTGFSRAGGTARKRTFLVDPARAFAALGVSASAAPSVVVTHAHYDHIGNLGLFPQSELVMAESEYDFWTGRHATRAQFHHSVEDEELEHLVAARREGRVTAFRGEHDLAPGIRIIEVGGHTPGQSVVQVNTSDGPVLLASDAIHYDEEYERDRPFAYVADVVEMYGCRRGR